MPKPMPQVPLPGLGKKGVTIMGHHVSNDALLMTVGGIIAAVVLFRIGKPSASNATAPSDLYQPGNQPASVDGVTSSSPGSGTPGPADPPTGGPAAAPSGGAPAIQPSYITPTGAALGAAAGAAFGSGYGPSGITQMWDAAHSLASYRPQGNLGTTTFGVMQNAGAAFAKAAASRPAAPAGPGSAGPGPGEAGFRPPTSYGGPPPQSVNAGSAGQVSQPAARQKPVPV